MVRILDVLFSTVGLILFSPLLLVLLILGYFDTGSPLFVQTRVGRNQQLFKLIKFRTMYTSTEQAASHLVSVNAITPLGRFLRRTKLDELPQLINVIKGEMSLVGPRPNLDTQYELIREREAHGVYNVLPGITGLAQLRNIDMSKPRLLARADAKMIQQMSLQSYLSLILLTALGKGRGDRVINK
jgi:lipopolysaccharide/colanic/teichoic acid biosynthesis glycosyltransferase